MLVHNSLHLILNFAEIMFLTNQACTTSCQVYPSEYAFHKDSVGENEMTSANCKQYPRDLMEGVAVFTDEYTHCDGTQLKLTDSNLGEVEYQFAYYYRWKAGSDEQLLFIFPTVVSLTTITLHYYSDNAHHLGLPRLRFYAVLDDFDVWDAPDTSIPYADSQSVPPGGEPAGQRNVSINVNFNTKKVLMYKYSSTSFVFAVSEVEFFTCEITTTSNPNIPMQAGSDNAITSTRGYTTTNSIAAPISTMLYGSNTGSATDKVHIFMVQTNSSTAIAIGVSTAALLTLLTTLIITIFIVVLIWSYKRRSVKKDLYTDTSYSTLNRGSGQQTRAQLPIQHDSAELYDQIHLSPSTGQTEFIPKSENENINIPAQNHPTYSDIIEASTATSQASSQLPPHNTDRSSSEQSTYATVDKNKEKQRKKGDTKHNIAEKKGPPISPYSHAISSSADEGGYATGKGDSIMKSQELLGNNMYVLIDKEKIPECQEITAEELYTAVKKKPKGGVPKDEEETPPIPPHTVEELYTAVVKKPKGKADENDQEAPPLPPHTTRELYTAVKKTKKTNKIAGDSDCTASSSVANTDSCATKTILECQSMVEQVVCQEISSHHVLGKLDDSVEGEASIPLIDPYTTEELYTAVNKLTK